MNGIDVTTMALLVPTTLMHQHNIMVEINNKVETDDGDDEDKRILSCPSCFDKGVDIGVLNGLCVEKEDNKERHEEQGVEKSSR